MSLTYKDSKEATPIAKIVDLGSDKVIYLLSQSHEFPPIPKKNVKSQTYKCPYCKKVIKDKQVLIRHLSVKSVCPKKGHVVMETMPCIKLENYEKLIPIPLPLEEHSIIFVTGPPKCGKSYWINEYVKSFKKLYNKKVFLISRVDEDETLLKDKDKYIHISITEDLIKDPFKIEDFADSLIVFDDIESSEFPKATEKAYSLMDDLLKNGRHYNTAVIFANQESRMGKKTKPLLTTVTHIVVFPSSCSLYQTEKLLKEHMGMSKYEIEYALSLNTRWIMTQRARPQFVMYEHGIYMLGKQFY